MIVTIHQPEHLPWLGFFDKMRQADVFVLLDTTQFAKDDFQNRNRIKTRKGPTWLTVPVYKSGRSEQLIAEVEICNQRNWSNRCWSLIYQNYKDAHYFEKYAPFFEELYARDWFHLVNLNETIIRHLKHQFGLETELIMSSDLDIYVTGPTEVNLTICREVGADVYLSGKYGKEYLDVDEFTRHGIEVRYQNFNHPEYPQQWDGFLPRMSSIDLLFNCGEASLQVIEQANGHAAGS
jgi:hypothetical protein